MKIYDVIIVGAGPTGAIAGNTPSKAILVHALPVLQSTGIICQQHLARMDIRLATRRLLLSRSQARLGKTIPKITRYILHRKYPHPFRVRRKCG